VAWAVRLLLASSGRLLRKPEEIAQYRGWGYSEFVSKLVEIIILGVKPRAGKWHSRNAPEARLGVC